MAEPPQKKQRMCPAAEVLRDLQPGEGPARCQWSLDNPHQKSPHPHVPLVPPKLRVMDSILENIGNTPMVRLHSIPHREGIECEILAKCEFFNAGGSVKDRIGKRMVLDAEASGRIKPGDTLIEPTSGNTGIGLALAAALRGYRMIITLPEKMSQEKVDVLKALGAEIIRTPTEAAFDSPDSHIGVAKRLNREIPNSHILDQYSNISNPLAHYDGTAEEILEQCEGRVDKIVLTAGTGGTITGIARKIKERLPHCEIIGVDPNGSILALPESLNGKISSYKVEGIGYDFIPVVLNREIVDRWVKSDDKESFLMARRLIREEGLLCGGSSGAAMHAAVQIAKEMKKGERIVVLLADSVRNYMSKFLNDKWMVDNGFMEEDEKDENSSWWAQYTVRDLNLPPPRTIKGTLTCQDAIDVLNSQGFDQLPILDDDGNVEGMVAVGNLTSQLLSGRIQAQDSVRKAMYSQFKKIYTSTSLARLSRYFQTDHFALVMKNSIVPGTKPSVAGIATPIDLLNFITRRAPRPAPSPSPN